MHEDEVIDELRNIAFLLRKKMRKRAADIIDGYKDLHHASKLFHKDPHEQEQKIQDATSRAGEMLSEIKSKMNELEFELGSAGRDLRDDADKFMGMIEEEERILELIGRDEKRIPELIGDFYHTNNMLYNMALTMRNDYELAKKKMYSRKE